MDIPSFEFSSNSSNTTLQKHLAKHHRDEYIGICSSNSWRNQLPGITVPASVTITAAPGTTRESYSDDAFLQKIVNWIIADDQVLLFYYYLFLK